MKCFPPQYRPINQYVKYLIVSDSHDKNLHSR